jgi:hypothetical protein
MYPKKFKDGSMFSAYLCCALGACRGRNLEIIDLSNNSITGRLPASVAKPGALRQLSLARNHMAESSELPVFLTVDR